MQEVIISERAPAYLSPWAWGWWKGLGWLQGNRRLGFERGHMNSGSHAVHLETVPSKGFQPWSTSFKAGGCLLWGPLKKEIHTQPIQNLIITSCISGDLGFYVQMWSGGLQLATEMMSSFRWKTRELSFNTHCLSTHPNPGHQRSMREKSAPGTIRSTSQIAGTLGTAAFVVTHRVPRFCTFLVSNSRISWLPELPDPQTSDVEWHSLATAAFESVWPFLKLYVF